MQLVLVAGFNTSKQKSGPNVLLGAGKWRINTEHQKDCILALSIDDPAFNNGQINTGFEFTLTKDCLASVSVTIPGTESAINVFAERM